jgi:hypothetical protein
MPRRYIKGDLFEHDYDPARTTVIAHVCNDQGVMGSSGFVVPLAQHFPWAKEAYVNWFKDNPLQLGVELLGEVGSPSRGQTQMVTVKSKERQSLAYGPKDMADRIVVANMVAQDLGSSRPLYYNDLVKCMEQVAHSDEIQSGGEIICPMFGSALAGGDWRFIEELITDCWLVRGIQVTVYYLERFLDEDMLTHIAPCQK